MSPLLQGILAWAALPLGFVVLLLTWASLLHTVTGPRGRTSLLARTLGRMVETAFSTAARRLAGDRRERLLSLTGPVAFLVVLAAWLVGFAIGYAFVLVPLLDQPPVDVVLASAMATLTAGFGPGVGGWAAVVSIVATGNGLIVVTLELAYLPSLYAAYNRREAAVTMAARRCRGPLTGTELLARHFEAGALPQLANLYLDWERWSADVAETHTNYPILTSFRSPEPREHWLTAFLAMLDAATLHSVLSPVTCPVEARFFLEGGAECLTRVGRARRDIRHLHAHGQEQHDAGMLMAAARRLGATEAVSSAGDAELGRRFHLARGQYLPLVVALATRLFVDLGPDVVPSLDGRPPAGAALDHACPVCLQEEV